MLTTCSFQILFGRIYTFFPAKWVFLVAVAIFEVGSLVVSLGHSSLNDSQKLMCLLGWRFPKFRSFHCRPCAPGSWHFRNHFWRFDVSQFCFPKACVRTAHCNAQYHLPSRSTRKASDIRWRNRRHGRCSNGCSAFNRWGSYGPSYLEMVFLYQSSYRWSSRGNCIVLSQSSEVQDIKNILVREVRQA